MAITLPGAIELPQLTDFSLLSKFANSVLSIGELECIFFKGICKKSHTIPYIRRL
jgi:hypothetical protein